MKNQFLTLCFSILLTLCHSQADSKVYSVWNMVKPSVQLNEVMNFSTQFHLRTENFYDRTYQELIRPHIDYKVSKVTTLGLGYTYVRNHLDEPEITLQEQNIYQQFLFKHSIGKPNLSHKIRIEERFIESKTQTGTIIQPGDTHFQMRFRYRIIGELPLSKPEAKTKFSAIAYDELMLDMTNRFRPEDLDQNWLFLGPKVSFSNGISITSGFHDIYDKVGDLYVENAIWDTSVSIPIK